MQEVRGSIPLTSTSFPSCHTGTYSHKEIPMSDFSDLGLDPELAALLDDTPVLPAQRTKPALSKQNLFSSSKEAIGKGESTPNDVDLTVATFPEVTQTLAVSGHGLFETPAYYKKVLGGENESAQRVHTILSKYLTCQDPKDRGVYRQQLITAWWDFAQHLALKAGAGTAIPEKKYALRFGLVLPTLLSPEQREMFSRVIDENPYGEPLYYIDEWLREIGRGRINPSTTDEVKSKSKDDSSRFQQLLSKAQGKLQSAENLLRAKSEERLRYEGELKRKLEGIFDHESLPGFTGVKAPFTEAQKRAMNDLSEGMRTLISLDKDLSTFLRDCQEADADVRSLQQKVDESGGGVTNSSGVAAEFDTIRQMAKMSCGRQGNHFPFLTREYFHSSSREVGIRENILETMRWLESIDPEAYCRQYKSQLNRIPPFVIILPTYGDYGFCWEPFDRYNRVTSRGRIAIPMYAKNLQVAVLTAVADLRWQVAKEKASYYWMEEGLTGNYYQWFQSQKLKGDVKEYFINDYLLWMLKESDGIQKLSKEVRGVFWRYMPFAPEIKAKLKVRALVYQELCQRDLNRELSDGY